MRGAHALGLLAFLATATVAACATFSSSGDTVSADGGPSEAGQGTPSDAAADGPADATSEAGFDDDFENTANCNPWMGGSGVLLTVVPGGANGTAHACHVCLPSTSSSGFAYRRVNVPAGSYVFDGYLRSNVDGGKVQALAAYMADGGTAAMYSNFTPLPSWSPMQVANIQPQATEAVQVTLTATLTPGGCFDMDELTLR
jgi:hypothetical protein